MTGSNKPLLSHVIMPTTELSQRLGFNVTVKFITSLGIVPALKSRMAVYWSQEDLPRIHGAIIGHLAELQRAALEDITADADLPPDPLNR